MTTSVTPSPAAMNNDIAKSKFGHLHPAPPPHPVRGAVDSASMLPPSSDRQQKHLYSQARALLEEMARVGNPAANDYVAMLGDVDALVNRVLARRTAFEQADALSLSQRGLFEGRIGVDGSAPESDGLDASISGVPFLDTADFSFQNMVQGDAWQAIDWDGLLNTWPTGLS